MFPEVVALLEAALAAQAAVQLHHAVHVVAVHPQRLGRGKALEARHAPEGLDPWTLRIPWKKARGRPSAPPYQLLRRRHGTHSGTIAIKVNRNCLIELRKTVSQN